MAVIDGIRGPLVVFVLALHFNALWDPAVTPLERLYFYVIQLGIMSMEVFFVVSGFLITGILLRAKGSSEHYFKVFYGRRVLRILPLYFRFIAVWFWLVCMWPWATRTT